MLSNYYYYYYYFWEQVRNFIKLKKKYAYKENLYKSKASYRQLAIDKVYTTVAKKRPILNNYFCLNFKYHGSCREVRWRVKLHFPCLFPMITGGTIYFMSQNLNSKKLKQLGVQWLSLAYMILKLKPFNKL